MCWGGGGGDYTHPFLLSTGRRYVALWPLLTHAGGRKIIIIISIQHRRRKTF